MTEEEMKNKIAEAEVEAAKAKAEADELKTQRSNQNAYITKLEGKVKGLEGSMETVKQTVNTQPALAPEIVEYFQKQRREDYMKQAEIELISQVGEAKYHCIEPDLNNFLKLYMTEKNVSVRYIVDSFHLLLGRAMANPDHAIQALINIKQEEQKPTEQPVSNTDQEMFRSQLSNMVNKTMTPDDIDRGGAPEVKAPTVMNTKEAMNAFKTRLFNLDSSKFE
jgi:hypothetical protein